MFQVLYKLKTAKIFERARGKEEKPSADIVEEDPFAIQTLCWCPESRMLCVAGVSAHIIVYSFSKQEITTEVVQVGRLSRSTAVVQDMFDCRQQLPPSILTVGSRRIIETFYEVCFSFL